MDRCHRLGQTRQVRVYTMIADNTVDWHMHQVGHISIRHEY